MKSKKYIVLALCALVLAGCGVQKIEKGKSKTESTPTWHTCLIQGARATITQSGGERYSSSVTMQAVHDSMIVISVTPFLGVEMLRLEATPLELTAIDKIHGQYAVTTYTELNRKLTPTLNWDILQQVCSAELPTGPEKARLRYALGKEEVEITIDYTPRQTDVPVRVSRLRLDKFTKVDISKWL